MSQHDSTFANCRTFERWRSDLEYAAERCDVDTDELRRRYDAGQDIHDVMRDLCR